MSPEVITDHLHRFALAGLQAMRREYARRKGRQAKRYGFTLGAVP